MFHLHTDPCSQSYAAFQIVCFDYMDKSTEWLLIWMQIISWLVAALVIVINGYLLVEFFSSEVNGAAFTTVVGVFTAAYVAFVLYLALRAITFLPWQRVTQTKTITNTQN